MLQNVILFDGVRKIFSRCARVFAGLKDNILRPLITVLIQILDGSNILGSRIQHGIRIAVESSFENIAPCLRYRRFLNLTVHMAADHISVLVVSRPLKKIGFVKLRCLGYAVNLSDQLIDLVLYGLLVGFRHGAVACLDRQFVHSLEHILNFIHRALCGLHCADTVLRISGSLCQSTDLSAHLLGNRKPCRIVSRTVDLVS